MKALHIRVEDEEYEKLREISYKQRISIAEIVRRALREFMRSLLKEEK